MLIGYARTSTIDQKAGLDKQVEDLRAAGCSEVVKEHISGVATARKNLRDILDRLQPGDALAITKPDRLARSTADLLSIVDELRKRGIGLVIQSMGLDTRGNGSNPTARLMLTLLAGVAEFERDIMLERQRDGIAQAKKDGKYRGKAPKRMGEHGADIRALLDLGQRSPTIAKTLGLSRSTVHRLAAQIQHIAVEERA